MVTMSNQTTTCTNVFALRKQFLCSRTATAAILTGIAWVYLLNLSSSVFSFGDQDQQESAPGDTCNGTGEHAARQSLDVQIFDGDKPEGAHDAQRRLIVKMSARSDRLQMPKRDLLPGFAPVPRTFDLTASSLRRTARQNCAETG